MAEDIPKTDWGPGFSKLHVDKFCGRQSSANRFGPSAPRRIKQMLRGHPPHWTTNLADFDDDDADGGDESWEDEDEDDAQDSDGFEQAVDFWGHLGAGGDQSEASSTASFESVWSKGKKRIPRVARQRLNLTALSQHHDLYFAAYQDEVHVFQPQQAPQILQKPLLVLKPKPTPLADKIGGHIDPINHHQINHLIVGELGSAEVLLFAYDDGDVMAYYTSTIARCATRNQERTSQRTPRPFMCETVGKSAWGLAIHKQSRLIAVSSNLHEVTVFAFALGGRSKPGQDASSLDQPRAQKSKAGSTSLSPQSSRLEPADLERQLRSRERTWRILLPAGHMAQNMPCISFIDNESGEAERVAAVDISGSCWVLDIWKVGSTSIRLQPIDPVQRVGWGVLALPLSSFLPTKYGTHCLGADPRACPRYTTPGYGQHFETTASLLNVDDNAAHEAVAAARLLREKHDRPLPDPSPRIAQEIQLPDCEEYDDDEVVIHEPFDRWQRLTAKRISVEDKAGIDVDSEARHGFQQALIAVPSLGFSYQCHDQMKLLQVLKKSDQRKACVQGATLNDITNLALLDDYCLKRCVLLRSYDARIEVGTLDYRDPLVICDDVVSQINYNRDTPLWDEPWSERLNMLIYVSELNLVVAGSMCGRVALLRLTAAPKGKQPRASFRTEWLLPRESDEKKRLRPYVALLGVAISPMREPGARGFDLMQEEGSDAPRRRSRLPTYPKRWRLILHYIDHTILQYTIQAEEPGADDMAIF